MPSLLLMAALAGCSEAVNSDGEAELAYLGLDLGVQRALELGLAGFNAADSANIPPQSAAGDFSGTMTVSGQVDQGSSDNKGLRLDLALEAYADLADLDEDDEVELLVSYQTDAEQGLPRLELQLRDIPDGSLVGTLVGTAILGEDLEGAVQLDLALDGSIEDDGAGGLRRVEGSTAITGTVTNEAGGSFAVDLLR